MQAGSSDLKSEVLPPLHRQYLHSPILMLLLAHSILHIAHPVTDLYQCDSDKFHSRSQADKELQNSFNVVDRVQAILHPHSSH